MYFRLIYGNDYKGDTPLHLAVSLQTDEPSTLTFLQLCLHRWKTSPSFKSKNYPAPWTVRNSKGNTYLHEAARVCSYKVIFSDFLIDKDIKDVNDHGETVFHVMVKYATETAKNYLENLTKQMQSLVYIQDSEGFTPVLRALQYGRLGMAMLLIQQCPRSVEIPDNKGRTVLHHLRALVVDLVDQVKDILPVWNEFFKRPGVDELRIAQNEDGNTPLHLAIIEGDFTKSKFLMEKCLQSENRRELIIVNNDGHLVFELVSSQAHILAMKELQSMVSRSYVKETNLIDKAMDDELYRAAIEGNIKIFDSMIVDDVTVVNDTESRPPNLPEAYFCSQTPGGSNIIHIALRHGKENKRVEKFIFIEIALERYPILSMQSENKGDTPLHLAVKWKSGLSIVKLLIKASQNFLLDESKKAFYVAPWAMKNYKGCFPIHEALQSGNLKAAEALFDCDTEANIRVSNLGDTALHSFAKNGLPIGEDVDESLDGNFKKTGKQLFEIPEADAQRFVQDIDGNTPLHYAIINKNSIAAIVLTDKCLEDDEQRELGLVNKEGQTIPDLLALHDVPYEIIELIKKKVPKAVYLARSSYGIRKTEMKESANALSVVAALLATITFAVAFQLNALSVLTPLGDGNWQNSRIPQ
uniref:PGG domain-containing protein n=1 Tax=Chenopodium quinoa TaxID=63459 RepID=A0A803MXR2_CHEQI